MRQPVALPAVIALLSLVSPAALVGQGQNFILLEATRLPADTSGPGTSTTDVDLVDVDGDGDLDIFKAQGTDSLDGRPNQLLINDGRGRSPTRPRSAFPPAPPTAPRSISATSTATAISTPSWRTSAPSSCW